MPRFINSGNVRWTYFAKVGEEIVAYTERPEDKKPTIALINSSTFPGGKSATPELLKQNIQKLLNHPTASNLVFAVPSNDLAEMRHYYGTTNDNVYTTLRMHDDLMQGNPDFLQHEARFEGTMPAKRGAEQLASAIENGFDIWSYNSGGNSIAPKLELCEEHFARNFEALRKEGKLQKKVRFIGFSNGTTMAFHLRGLVDYCLGYGVSYSFKRMGVDVGEGSLTEQVDDLLRSFSGKKIAVIRKFNADEKNFELARARYEEAAKLEAPISNLAIWLGQIVPVTVGKLPKFAADEKIILELEYAHKTSRGYEADRALDKFLNSGAIDPKNILFITLGDFIDSSEENVPRKNGRIPDYETLQDADKREIVGLAKSEKSAICQDYIDASNKRSQELMDQITEVAARHGIPTIQGGERRVGHGKYSALAPSHVESLEFDETSRSITQTCALARMEVREDLILGTRTMVKHSTKIASAENPELARKINEAKIMLLTTSTRSFAAESEVEEIVAGLPIDLAELASDQIEGKGVVVYLPMVKGMISSSEQLNAFQMSENYQKAKFIILMMRLPRGYFLADGSVKEEMIANRNANYRQLIEDLTEHDSSESTAIQTPPIFISTTSVEIEDFQTFPCEIDLRKMAEREPQTVISNASIEETKQQAEGQSL